ncbi:MAG: glycosyltransferase [Planctomycetaceae bacterium]
MYIQLISIHGLVRGHDIEMGRDSDTGGQIVYVLELARTLAQFDEVEQVDLFTRRIKDKRVSDDYAQEVEELDPKCRIIRLPCGGGRYLRKEKLWPTLDEFVDNMIAFTTREGRTPTVVHGHYADAGYVARVVASAFDVPFIFTGHSLGKPKFDYLAGQGMTWEEAVAEYHIDQRIQVEQDCLAATDLVVTSTSHERDNQYQDYVRDPELRVEVIPPGTDLSRFFPYYHYQTSPAEIDENFKQARHRMHEELRRFFFQPDKPLILALCRPDSARTSAALAALWRVARPAGDGEPRGSAGVRDDIDDLPDSERQVLTDMLLMMDRYDLYGKMAVPKQLDIGLEVPELYRIAASSHGVSVNSAFTELFGLTLIESSACGLPFVSTSNGGPTDIARNCERSRC